MAVGGFWIQAAEATRSRWTLCVEAGGTVTGDCPDTRAPSSTGEISENVDLMILAPKESSAHSRAVLVPVSRDCVRQQQFFGGVKTAGCGAGFFAFARGAQDADPTRSLPRPYAVAKIAG